jgi:undecaprenyl diphosphate synthase
VIGDMNMLPDYARKELNEALEITKDNKGLNLIMALSYSGSLGVAECGKEYCTGSEGGQAECGKH